MPEGTEGWSEMTTEDNKGLETESPEGAEALRPGGRGRGMQPRLCPHCHYTQCRAEMGRLLKP